MMSWDKHFLRRKNKERKKNWNVIWCEKNKKKDDNEEEENEDEDDEDDDYEDGDDEEEKETSWTSFFFFTSFIQLHFKSIFLFIFLITWDTFFCCCLSMREMHFCVCPFLSSNIVI